MVKNLIFDMGGVVFDLGYEQAVRRFEEIGVRDARAQLDPCIQSGIFGDLEGGRISCEEFRQGLSAHVGRDLTAEECAYAWKGYILDLPQRNLDKLLELRSRGYRLFLLSNTNPFITQWAHSPQFSLAATPAGLAALAAVSPAAASSSDGLADVSPAASSSDALAAVSPAALTAVSPAASSSDGLTEVSPAALAVVSPAASSSNGLLPGWPMDHYFEKLYFSCDLKMMKPDPAIFRHVLDAEGLDPAETLFIDDSPRNTEAATLLGIRTMCPRNNADWTADIENYL